MNLKQHIQLIGYFALYLIIVSFNTALTGNEKNSQIMGASQPKKAAHIVFLVTEDSLNYEAHKTIPEFGRLLKERFGYKVTVLLGQGTHGAYTYTDFDVVEKADLLIIFARRIALPHKQMEIIKSYINSGRPVIGIRTANHAFTVWDKISEGFEDWPEFVATVLGCENRGYGPIDPGTDVSLDVNAINHPVVQKLQSSYWHSKGNIYKVAPLLDSNITVILRGKADTITEPVAWARRAGRSKVFYTSLGHPTDFQTTPFINLLLGGIKWALTVQE